MVRTPPVVILNTVPPRPEAGKPAPPNKVVPYRLPSFAWMRPALGRHPSLQSEAKECSVVRVPPVVILKSVPPSPWPP